MQTLGCSISTQPLWLVGACQRRAPSRLKRLRDSTQRSSRGARPVSTWCQASDASSPDAEDRFTLDKFSTSFAYLEDAQKLYTAGQELLTAGQTRRGRKILRGAQQQLIEANNKALLINRVKSKDADLALPVGPLTEAQVQKASSRGVLALFIAILSFTGLAIGAPLLLAGALGIAVTSLATVSDFVTNSQQTSLLVWYATLFVILPFALNLGLERIGQITMFDSILLLLQTLYCQDLDKMTTQAYIQELDGTAEDGQKLRERQSDTLKRLQGLFEAQVAMLVFQSFVDDEVKKACDKAGLDVNDLND